MLLETIEPHPCVMLVFKTPIATPYLNLIMICAFAITELHRKNNQNSTFLGLAHCSLSVDLLLGDGCQYSIEDDGLITVHGTSE